MSKGRGSRAYLSTSHAPGTAIKLKPPPPPLSWLTTREAEADDEGVSRAAAACDPCAGSLGSVSAAAQPQAPLRGAVTAAAEDEARARAAVDAAASAITTATAAAAAAAAAAVDSVAATVAVAVTAAAAAEARTAAATAACRGDGGHMPPTVFAAALTASSDWCPRPATPEATGEVASGGAELVAAARELARACSAWAYALAGPLDPCLLDASAAAAAAAAGCARAARSCCHWRPPASARGGGK